MTFPDAWIPCGSRSILFSSRKRGRKNIEGARPDEFFYSELWDEIRIKADALWKISNFVDSILIVKILTSMKIIYPNQLNIKVGGTSGGSGNDAGSGATRPVSGSDISLPGTKP